jgi:hypothetical protein
MAKSLQSRFAAPGMGAFLILLFVALGSRTACADVEIQGDATSVQVVVRRGRISEVLVSLGSPRVPRGLPAAVRLAVSTFTVLGRSFKT